MTNTLRRYFIFAGEASGDLHGSRLIQALKLFSTPHHFTGVGGPSMRAEGLECVLNMEDFQIMGFSDVLRSLPKLWRQFYTVCETILRVKPDVVILIDYPGFNLRLAHALRRKGFQEKIIQYICPTVWAHGKKRIQTMSRTLDLLLTIYPFEPAYFANTSLSTIYIGNPLVEYIQQYVYDDNWSQQVGCSLSHPLVAIFPGSRLGEIKCNLPQQLLTSSLLKKDNPQIHFALSYAHENLLPTIQQIVQQSPLQLNRDIYLVPKTFTYELMRDCHTALATSGTVTLELALHARPSVVMYRLSNLNYLIAKYLLRLRLPHYCIVNILGGREIFPEIIGRERRIDQLSKLLKRLYYDERTRNAILEGCQYIRDLLGQFKTNQLAAHAVMELLTC